MFMAMLGHEQRSAIFHMGAMRKRAAYFGTVMMTDTKTPELKKT